MVSIASAKSPVVCQHRLLSTPASKTIPSMVPLVRQLGASKRSSMQSLASKTAWEAAGRPERPAFNFVRPDCPPVDSDTSFNFTQQRTPEVEQMSSRSFDNKFNSKPKFRSALEQVCN